MRIRDQTFKFIGCFIAVLLLLLLFMASLAVVGLFGFAFGKFIAIFITVQGG